MARQVDVEQLARWFVAVLLAAAEDADQGYMALDLDRPEARWFWIAWDLDLSFRTHEERRGWLKPQAPGRAARNAIDPRRLLIGRLLAGSAEFRGLVRRTLETAERSAGGRLPRRSLGLSTTAGRRSSGDLSVEARAEVARFLADHPTAARRFMDGLR